MNIIGQMMKVLSIKITCLVLSIVHGGNIFEKRIKDMISANLNFGPVETVGSVLDFNPHLTGSSTDELRISEE